MERTTEGDETVWTVDGERNVDVHGAQISVRSSSGSALNGTTIKLFDPLRKRSIETGFEVRFDQMLNRMQVPPDLRGRGDEAWRRMLEHSAFDMVCSGPDPSLQRLLSQGAALQWWPGTPRMPESYAVFVAESGTDGAHWIEYLGANHRRLTAEHFSDELELIGEQGALRLLRSGHGAVVVDAKRATYAWVYVYPGGRKLRFPSVIGGAIAGDSVILDIDQPTLGVPKQKIVIDIPSGAVREMN